VQSVNISVSEERNATSVSSQLAELRNQFRIIEETFARILPKVDRTLTFDFLNLEKAAKGEALPYTLEVYTKEGIDTDQAKKYVSEKTGMIPAISEEGTHYTTNQILTLEMLKEMNDSDDVIEITGSYTGEIAWHTLRHAELH